MILFVIFWRVITIFSPYFFPACCPCRTFLLPCRVASLPCYSESAYILSKVCSKWTCNRFKIMKIIFEKRLFSALKRVWYTYCHWYLQCYERLISMQQTSAIRPSPSFHSVMSLVATVWAAAPLSLRFPGCASSTWMKRSRTSLLEGVEWP